MQNLHRSIVTMPATGRRLSIVLLQAEAGCLRYHEAIRGVAVAQGESTSEALADLWSASSSQL
jgi:hypothetical protein